MKYTILTAIKKFIATIMAVFMAISGKFGGGKDAPLRPDANTVTPYSVEDSDYQLNIDAANEVHDISDLLFGAFFEDINFAADGGIYAEMVANRSFEFPEKAENDQLYRWSTVGTAKAEVKINDTKNCLNENNTNYLVLTNTDGSAAGIENKGFLEGMAVENGKSYKFSAYIKALDNYSGAVKVSICQDGKAIANGVINNISADWVKYTLTLKASASAAQNVTLRLTTEKGTVAMDMISLFPEDTYKGRENGMRKDICEYLAAMEPKFLRFPGGCVIEGENKETQYSWKDSVATGSNGTPLEFDGRYGDIAARKQGENIWTDHGATNDPYPCFMTYGLGFYEYFLLAEDIGAVGVPVFDCGLYCQMRGKGPIDMNSAEFKQYIQDMFDLIEFCRGDENTIWGALRIAMGHSEPFKLKYVAVGNENEGKDYFERYQAFLDAFNKAKAENPEFYDGIELIYSAGASDATHGEMYIKSYEYAKNQLGAETDVTRFAGATDQHYYNTPEWFKRNADYYDENNYIRTISGMTDTPYGGAIPVFVGEYAAWSNNLKAAIAEAAYMTGLERNGDIVRMAAYAPLFSSKTAWHWSPNLIWFDNHSVTGSINYYVQKLFSVNQGSKLLKSELKGAAIPQADLKGRVGVGVWYTIAQYDNIVVTDNLTGKVIEKENFSTPDLWWNWQKTSDDGKWKIKKGALLHDSDWMSNTNIGDPIFFGTDDEMSNYTYTVEATKVSGSEGFTIPFAVKDKDNFIFWNIGGWQNTISCLQQVENGAKTGKIPGTIKEFTAEDGKTYKLKVVVSGTTVKCYIDDVLYVDYDFAKPAEAEAYQVVSTDESGDIIIKLVNVTAEKKTFAVKTENAKVSAAKAYQVAGENLEANNLYLSEDEQINIKEYELKNISESFNYTVPANSVTVIRLAK